MFAYTHSRILHLTQVFLAVGLFIILATGAFAAPKSYRPEGSQSDKNATERKADSRDSRDSRESKDSKDSKDSRDSRDRNYRPQSSPTRSDRPDNSRSTVTDRSGYGSYRPGSSGRDSSSYKPGDRNKYGTYRPNDNTRSSYRPDSKPATSYPGYNTSRTGQTREYRPGYNDNARSYKPYENKEYRPDNYNAPKSYKPPTYRNGHYYYDSHRSTRPYYYGHWVFDNYDSGACRRSLYYHYGYLPYIQVTRVYVTPYITQSYYGTPVLVDGGYYLEKNRIDGLDRVLADIRNAWIECRFDLMENHIASGERLAVLLDGRYDYSIDSDDYLNMTRDAIDEIDTISFTWQGVRQRSDGYFTAYATHRYRDDSDISKTVYLSYTLQKIGRDFRVVEVGSSQSPLI